MSCRPPIHTLSPFIPMRWNSFPKSSLRHTKTASMCSPNMRLRTCLLIMSLITKFTLRMTRCLCIATSVSSLAQSLASFRNFLMICLAKGSSNHPNHQQVHLSSLPRRKMAPCNSVSTSKTSTRSLGRSMLSFVNGRTIILLLLPPLFHVPGLGHAQAGSSKITCN